MKREKSDDGKDKIEQGALTPWGGHIGQNKSGQEIE